MKGETLDMSAKIMSSFAAGLLFATSVCASVYFFGPSEAASKVIVEKPTEQEMKSMLVTQGYVIHTEEEWQEKEAAVEAAATTEEESAEEEVKEESNTVEVKEKIIYRTILNVSTGMTSIDVGRALVQGNIIDDAMKFFNEVEKRGLSNKLRPGTYELDSEMSMDKVMSTIFK